MLVFAILIESWGSCTARGGTTISQLYDRIWGGPLHPTTAPTLLTSRTGIVLDSNLGRIIERKATGAYVNIGSSPASRGFERLNLRTLLEGLREV